MGRRPEGGIRLRRSADMKLDRAFALLMCGYRGVEPRSNVSMIIMRPPQHGHGWGGWSVAAALSGARCFWAVCAGFAAAISSRARATVWALVPLASRP